VDIDILNSAYVSIVLYKFKKRKRKKETEPGYPTNVIEFDDNDGAWLMAERVIRTALDVLIDGTNSFMTPTTTSPGTIHRFVPRGLPISFNSTSIIFKTLVVYFRQILFWNVS